MVRPVACVIAATAVATGVATAVLNVIAEGRGVDHALGPFGAVLFVISVAAPASVGLFVALRQPGNRIRVDSPGRLAVGRRRDRRLRRMAEGRTNSGIAKRLWLTEKTVETHVRAILMKIGPRSSGLASMWRGRPERSFVGMITKRTSPLLIAAVALLCAALLWPAAGRMKTIRIY